MKKRVISVLLVMLITASSLMMISCKPKSKVFLTKDEKYSITADEKWEYMTGELSEEAYIEIGCEKKDRYLLAGIYDAGSFDDFDGFSVSMLYFMKGIMPDASSQGTESVKINGFEAYRTALMGDLNEKDVFIINYTINCGEEYVQLMVWTHSSAYTEKCQTELEKIAESFNVNA